jgi:hypothetical protein
VAILAWALEAGFLFSGSSLSGTGAGPAHSAANSRQEFSARLVKKIRLVEKIVAYSNKGAKHKWLRNNTKYSAFCQHNLMPALLRNC